METTAEFNDELSLLAVDAADASFSEGELTAVKATAAGSAKGFGAHSYPVVVPSKC